ncbi:hypothetical protein RIF29_21741 [Crotalaria pallida]|uniref:BHLH domain-containing protein n=1 Tax=Crotalaria pallida TaxID=3830 RepID=A0AAN9F7B2_CROPI
MAMAEPLTLRNKLKALCTYGEDGWSYAIMWCYHPQNPLLLTVEDAYYEAQLGQEIANMFPQAYMQGKGIVGEAALTGKHIWVHSDGQNQEWNLSWQNVFEEDPGLHQQFSYGIKTIVAIPVKACGVVQFGSKKKILERVEFLEQTQQFLMEIDNVDMVDMSGNAVSPLDCEDYDLNGLLASFSVENSHDSNLIHAHDENTEDLLRKVHSSESVNNPFVSLFDIYQEGMTSFHGDSCVTDQLNATKEGQVALSDRDITDVLLTPNSSMNSLIVNDTDFGAWDGEVSCFDSFGQQLVSANENAFSFSELTVQDSALSTLYSMNIGACQDKLQNLLDNQQSSRFVTVDFPPSSNTLHGPSKNIEAVDMSEEFLKFSSLDDLCQWFLPSPDDNNIRTITALDNNTPSESIELNPTSFGPVGTSSLSNNSIETSAVVHSPENSFLDFNCDQANEWWENMPTPALSPAIFSECVSELNTSTLTGMPNGLLFLEPSSGEASYNPLNSSVFEYNLPSNENQEAEFSPMNINVNAIQFGNFARPAEARANLMQPISNSEKTNNLVRKQLQEPRWIDDVHSINIGRAAPAHSQTKEPEEGTTNPTKKRARQKESTRPRPKDRQLIQDCIKKLRGKIPNGEKYSIVSLLGYCIDYMKYLQIANEYADILREPDAPKLIKPENEVVLVDSNDGDYKIQGVTPEFGLGNQTMEFQIIVDDMKKPHHMRIEILCEDRGFDLDLLTEPCETLGLNIIKGKMDIIGAKAWALFFVEKQKNRQHLTRTEVLNFLSKHLQQTRTSEMDSANNITAVIDPIGSWLRQSPENSKATSHGQFVTAVINI